MRGGLGAGDLCVLLRPEAMVSYLFVGAGNLTLSFLH